MKQKIILLLIMGSSFLLSNCIDKLGHAMDATDVCKKKWTKTVKTSGVNVAAKVLNGDFVLSAENLKAGVNLDISQASVSGDFEAMMKFENFNIGTSAENNSSFIQFYVGSNINIKQTAVANVSTNATSGIFADTVATSKSYTNTAKLLSGTLKISRVGSTITIVTVVNSISPIDGSTLQNVTTSVNNNFGTDNLIIGFQLGAQNDESKTINVNITEFSITNGGGTVISDSFNCNSLIY